MDIRMCFNTYKSKAMNSLQNKFLTFYSSSTQRTMLMMISHLKKKI